MTKMGEYKPSTSKRPVRNYLVRTFPVYVSGEKGGTIISPGVDHLFQGNEVKYVQGVDMGFLHVTNNEGDVLFSAPTQLVNFLVVTDEMSLPPLKDKDSNVIPFPKQRAAPEDDYDAEQALKELRYEPSDEPA